MKTGPLCRGVHFFFWSLAVVFLFAQSAVSAPVDMTTENWELVGKTRVSRTVYEFTYTADIVSNVGQDYENVTASLSSTSPHTVIVDGDLAFESVPAGATRNSSPDTFSFQQNRRYAFDPAALSWTVEGVEVVVDTDGDGTPDDQDGCPDDPDKIAPGVCGCNVSEVDSDNDGFADCVDACPDFDDNIDVDDDGIPDGCDPEVFTLAVTVTGNGLPVSEAQVTIGSNTVTGTTLSDGTFVAWVGTGEVSFDGINRFFPIEVAADGFATGHKKLYLKNQDISYNAEITLLPISDEITLEQDLNTPVSIDRMNEPVGQFTLPDTSLPAGVTDISGTVTYIDPTTPDIDAIPGGDLLALPQGSDPNTDTPVMLESFGMMEFDLKDQDGNQVTELEGPADVCMKLPASLADSKQDGDTIPLWYYDEDSGLWIEEGFGVVEDRGFDGKWACGQVTHFTWWNYDQPIETHSCFKYQFVDENTGDLINNLNWYAEGVSYSGTAPQRSCGCDSDDPDSACADQSISSFTVKKSLPNEDPEKIRVYTIDAGVRYYLQQDGDGTYSLTTNAELATAFNTPVEEGSCILNVNTDQCHFLDENDVVTGSDLAIDGNNGILPISTFNRAPVIDFFEIEQTQIPVGGTTNAYATAYDPEGDEYTTEWSASCWPVMGETLVAADSGSATFYAPESIENLSAVSCEITYRATDINDNTSVARRQVLVENPEAICPIEGRLYGTDGMPMSNYPLSLVGYETLTWEQTYFKTVLTDDSGNYFFENTACNGYEYKLSVTYEHNEPENPDDMTLEWTSDFWLGDLWWCGEYQESFENSQICQTSTYLPNLWGFIYGDYIGNLADINQGEPIRIVSYGSSAYPLNSYSQFFLDSNQYGPFAVPVEYGFLRSNAQSALYYVNHRGEHLEVDYGPDFTAGATGKVFQQDESPWPGVLVEFSGLDRLTGDYVTLSTTTDETGKYYFENLPFRAVSVRISGNGNDFIHNVPLMKNGEQITINVNEVGCQIEGTLYDPYGEVALWNYGSVYGALYSNDVFSARNQSNYFFQQPENGTFSFNSLGTGNLSLNFADSDYVFQDHRSLPVTSCENPIRIDLQAFPVPEYLQY